MQPMHHAAVGGYKFVVEFLVDRVDCNVFAQDKNGMTVLHHAAYHNMFDCVMFAFERGIDLDSQDGGKWTALMYAAQQGHIQMCALLLDLGAGLLIKNHVGKTAELIAEAYSMHDCRMVLQKAEAESAQHAALTAKASKHVTDDRRGTAIAFMKRRNSATGALLEDYDMEDMIGRGRTGAVYRVRHKITGTTRVLRTIPSNKYKDDTGLQQQINVMKAADHPNLAKLYGTYSEGGKVHIILQFCAGGSVMDRISKDGQFGESTAAKYFKQMLRAAQYMHNQDVVHRDLKLENFLFLSKEPDAPLKVSDFGLASREGEGERFAGGNVAYMAPETFHRSPDRYSDMWMLGVCLYMLVCGKLPFEAESPAKMVPLIRKCEWSFKEDIWTAVSNECKQLVSGLLKQKPSDRFSADQALAHPWFTQQTRRTMVDDQAQPMLQALKSNLERFAMQQKLEKAVLAIAVRNQDESQLKGLRQIFSALDTDQDGVLSVEEVERGLELSEVDIDPEMEAELEHILSVTGRVTYSDFMALMMDRAIMCEESVVKEAFSIFDRNRDGRLDIEELTAILKEDAGDLVRDYGDGNTLNLAQFRNLLSVMAAGKST
jgi:calcium-dependent protein kinase